VWGVRGSAPSSPRGGTERLLRSVGSNPARDRMATFPRTRGIFQTLKYHQCVLPFLCEAETSTSGQECQQQTPAFISHHPLLGQQRPPPLRILPAALVSSGQGKLALGQPKGQSTSWPQGFLLRITVISTTGHCQRERERARNRQEGGKFRLPRFLLTDTETSHQKAVDQCPKAPVCPVRRSRWPSTQAGREDPESPFFWQDLFPRGDNGSILSSLGPLKASGDFRIPGHQTPSLGTKSAFRLHFPSPGWLCAKPARDTCWRPGRGGFGFRPLLVHLKGQVPWCGIHTAVLGTGRC